MTYGYFQNTLWTKITGAVLHNCTAGPGIIGAVPHSCSAGSSQFDALLPLSATDKLKPCSRLSASDVQVQKSLRPAAVWQEIVSYIKGSAEAMETDKVRGVLS